MASSNPAAGRVTRFFGGIRRIFGRNIATIVFSLLLLYMAVSAVIYMTTSHIESYEVVSAPLSMNETYTALVLREESVMQAESGGYVNYYAREGGKINADGAVYGLSATKTPEGENTLSQEDLAKIRDEMQNFSKSFNPSNFNSTYSFKYLLEGSILQYAGVTGRTKTPVARSFQDTGADTSPVETPESDDTVIYGNQVISKAMTDGIVVYAKDGYENKTVDTLTEEDFDQNSYHKTDLKTSEPVTTGSDIYTIITDENWSILIPLTEKQAVKLADRPTMRVKFLKDDLTQTGDFEVITIGEGKYGKIDFDKGLIRYLSDRFLEIELVTNNTTGLKIPLSSFVTKEFYTVPSTFATTDEETGSVAFMVNRRTGDGKKETVVVTPTIYATIENERKGAPEKDPDNSNLTYTYYVDMNAFEEGDEIIRKDSQAKFLLEDKAPLEGVYCINQGYAVFRRIEVESQNDEYAIVKKNTPYGLVRYDHIVKNAGRVKEEDILY